MPKKDYHVVPQDGKWAVVGEGSARASSVHRTQHEAIDAGRGLAQRSRSELVIHRADGRIRDADSFGNDPVPPRDKKH